MAERELRPILRILAGYYGLLQIGHIVTLTWAGTTLLQSGRMPFPAQPPPGGWQSQVVPYLLGMGMLDAAAAGLGIWFAGAALFQGRVNGRVGLISLTMALTSAGVFAVGTWSAGVWLRYPLSYFGMLVLFLPVFVLYGVLLTRNPE